MVADGSATSTARTVDLALSAHSPQARRGELVVDAVVARSTWGRGGPGYRFGLEIVDDLRFDAAGVVGMARSSDPNSNGSQFYITLAPTPSLDGQYTVFGRLADADSVAVLARVVRGQPPTEPTRITRVTIEEAPR
jgi:cyclophilin family peptidyl-prolyl cis-trans isomerase